MKRLLVFLCLVFFANVGQSAILEDFGYGKQPWTGQNPLPVLVVMVEYADRSFGAEHSEEHYRHLLFGEKPSIRDYFTTISNRNLSLREAGIVRVVHPDYPETPGDERQVACARGSASGGDADNNNRFDIPTEAERKSSAVRAAARRGEETFFFECGAWRWDEDREIARFDGTVRVPRLYAQIANAGLFDFSAYDANGDGVLSDSELLVIFVLANFYVNPTGEYDGGGYAAYMPSAIRLGDIRLPRNRRYITVSQQVGFSTLVHEISHALGIDGARDVYAGGGRCMNNQLTIMSCTINNAKDDFRTLVYDAYHAMVRGWERPELYPLPVSENACIRLAARNIPDVETRLPTSYLFYDDRRVRDDGAEFFLMEYGANVGDRYEGNIDYVDTDRGGQSFTYDSLLPGSGIVLWHVDVDENGSVYKVGRFDGNLSDNANFDYSIHNVVYDALDNSRIDQGVWQLSDFSLWGRRGSTLIRLFSGGSGYEAYWVDMLDFGSFVLKQPFRAVNAGLRFSVAGLDYQGVAYVALGNDVSVCDSLMPSDELNLVRDEVVNGKRIIGWKNAWYAYQVWLEIDPAEPVAGQNLTLSWYATKDATSPVQAVRLESRLIDRSSVEREYYYTGALGEAWVDLMPEPPPSVTTGLGGWPTVQATRTFALGRWAEDLVVNVRATFEHPARPNSGHPQDHDLSRIAIKVQNPLLEQIRAVTDAARNEYDWDGAIVPEVDLEEVDAPTLPLPELLSPADGAVLGLVDSSVFRWQSNLGASAEGVRFRLCIAPEGGSFDCRLVNPPPTAGAGLTAVGAGSLLLLAGIGFATGSRRRWLIVLLVLGTGLVVNGCGGGGGGSNPAGAAPDVVVEVQETVTGLDRGRYRWYVEVEDKAGNVSSSPVRQFEIR